MRLIQHLRWTPRSYVVLLLLAFGAVHVEKTIAADVRAWTNAADQLRNCSLKGEINSERDAYAFEAAANDGCRMLHLNSPGGSVDIAVRLGKIARLHQMHVVVDPDSSFSSACVLVFAGGIMRLPYGSVKVHRPYFDANKATLQETQQRMDSLRAMIVAYLRSVNVQEALFDRMMQVAPEYAEPLTLKDLEDLGLSLFDPVCVETRENNRAVALRMTKRQFLQKKLAVTARCGRIDVPIGKDDADRVLDCWHIEFPGYFGE